MNERVFARGPRGFPFVARDVNHVLGTGQSLSTGATSTAASLTQPFANLMLAGGVIATGSFGSPLLPLVEATTETMSSAMANLVSVLDPTHDMLVSVHGVGGAPYRTIKKGTAAYANGMLQLESGRDRSAASGKSFVCRAVTCVHGESDAIEVNGEYANDVLQWQRDYELDVRTRTGQLEGVPMFISQNSFQSGTIIPQLMLDAHERSSGKVILVCPKYNIPNSDGLHLTTAGYRKMGEYYAKAYKRVILDQLTWEPVRPKSIQRNGAIITVVFHVPVAPLVFDTSLVAAVANMGFGYVNALTTSYAATSQPPVPAITNVALVGPDTVQVTLASVPTTPGRLRYAIDVAPGVNPRGNLRDSDATVSRFGFELFNWGVQFEIPVT